MKLSRRTLVLLTLTAGCGGGGSVSTPTGVVFTLDWPEATRVLPLLAKSVRVQIKQGTKLLAERLYLAGPDREEQLTDLPFATALTLIATAYPNADGTGQILASATIPFSTLKGKLQRVALTLTSVVGRVDVSLTKGATQLELNAIARDSAGSTVLTDPAQWQWTLNDATLGTLTPSGASATFTETGFGVAIFTATEKESGKSGTQTRPICVGEPSKVAATQGRFSLSGALSSIVGLGSGRFALVHGTNVSGIDSSGALLWERPLGLSGAKITPLPGGYMAVVTSAGLRIHSSEFGSTYWESPGMGAPAAATASTVFLQRSTGKPGEETLEARGMTSGDLLWTKTVATQKLVFADSTRLLNFDSTGNLLTLFQSTLGNLVWTASVPASSRFVGVRTTGSTPLVFSYAPGELRALLLTNGARLWSVAASGDSLYLTPDQSRILVYSGTQCAGYDAATGAQLWSKTGLREVRGPLASGELLVLPTVEDTSIQPVQALRASDGTALWSNYLPYTPLPSERFVPTAAGTQVFVTLASAATGTATNAPVYALDATTGLYLWGAHVYLGGTPGFATPVGSAGTLALQSAPSSTELLLLR